MLSPWGLSRVQEQEAGGAHFKCWGSYGTLFSWDPATSYNHTQYWLPHCIETNAHSMAEKSSLTSLTTLESWWLGQAWKEVGSCLWLLQGQGEVSTGWCYQCALLVSASHRVWLWKITFLALSWLSMLPNLQVSSFWSLPVSSQEMRTSQFSGHFYTFKRVEGFFFMPILSYFKVYITEINVHSSLNIF